MLLQLRQVISVLLARRLRFEFDLIPVDFENLSYKKAINWLLTESSVYFKPERPWGYPTLLQVEPTNRCNLRCVGCPVTIGLDRPLGGMPPAVFRSIIDEVREYLLMLVFWDWGEPFLNPQAYSMIRYAHEAGIKVVSSTNGIPFSRGDHARQVVESGLHVLVFSIDGTTQTSYASFRRLGDLDEALDGVRRVVAERRRQNSSTPFINLRFIVTKHNEHEVPYLKALSHELGVDALTLRKYRDWFHNDDYQPTDSAYQLKGLTTPQPPKRVRDNPCKHLWNCPTIHWDGAVCSCYVDYKGEHPLGQLGKRSFLDIWRGEDYQRLRRKFRTDWQNHPLCGTCNYGYEGGDIGREANAEVTFYNWPAAGRGANSPPHLHHL